MSKNNADYEATDEVVSFFLTIMHNFYTNPANEGDVLMYFKEFEMKCIRGWKKQMICKYPYDFNSQLSQCTDISKRKIERISLKE